MITKSALVSALNDDHSQDIGEFHEAREHLLATILESAADDADFDATAAEATIAKLFQSPSDRQAAIEKVRAVRKGFFRG